MLQEIRTIQLTLPYRLGSVNCYLIQTSAGNMLIDTGTSDQRAALEKELEWAGCTTGGLKLIVITHGDFDHTGSAAYLRQKFGAKIAMHAADAGMTQDGDMFVNRKAPNFLIKKLGGVLFRFAQADRFAPDLLVEDGYSFSELGFACEVVSIPGHSRGSIGILTAAGELFCGDLLDNTKKPGLSSIIDDPAAASASIERLQGLAIRTLYPGHGKPFTLKEL